MRLSDRYIGRQVLVGTLFAILLLSTILVMGSLFQNLRMLIVELGAPLSIIGEFLVAALPFALIYTIPWAFLSAVLLVFGRMSSENELTGFRVAGLSLTRLSMPVFVLGALLSAGCLWLNLEVAPWAKYTSKTIRMRAFAMDPRSMLNTAAEQDGLARFEESLKDVRAYIEKSDGDTMMMEGFHLFKVADPADKNARDIYVHAMKAKTVIDTTKNEFRLHLYDAMFMTSGGKPGEPGSSASNTPQIVLAEESVPVVLPYETREAKKDPASMSNAGIREAIEGLKVAQANVVARRTALKDEIAAMKERGEEATPLFEETQSLLKTEMLKDWTAYIPNYEKEIYRRYSASLACFVFAFIGIPLGIKARRKDTSSGLIISLLIGVAYFICGMLGGKSHTGVLIAAWAPNVVCVVLGLVLLRRARFR
ncbi:LptF/LptG family permease [Luteolibacter flavescens]|uniref:LptF/LptG family permease n=1 Tax=Luteolibacter flavescens TaxID=1859460 RepID=A0ABT3FIF6_9BACT|nr:LptF/LptG family permease [Luteolibacter flavescens]MCW1883352.1 LptF/LptG family permease [Luteolibacter flavescens]